MPGGREDGRPETAELGARLPGSVRFTVVEETPARRYIILPPRPPTGDRELTDAELEAAAGGEGRDYSWWTSMDEACQ